MNKFLLTSILVAAAAIPSMAQWVPTPTPNLKIEDNPGGLSSVELNGSLTINRACQDFAVLEKNGEVMKMIPASNKVAVYTFEGFTKFTKDEPGSLHITFWNDLKTSPFKYTGNYKVTIPAGFFFKADGTPNEEMSAEWGINNIEMIVTPSSGSSVNELKTITLTFPGAEKVEFNPTVVVDSRTVGSISYMYDPLEASGSEDGDEPYEDDTITPVIEGTTATITMPVDYESGVVTFTFQKGAFKAYYPGFENPSANDLSSAKFTIINVNDAYTITPPPGEIVQIPIAPFIDGDNTIMAYFAIYPPEGKKIGMVTKANASLYEVVDGVRSKSPIKRFTGRKYNQGDGAILMTIPGETAPILLSPGTYELVVAANADYTNRSPELTFQYIVPENEATAIKTIITPSNDQPLTSSLDKITVGFPEAQKVELKGSYATINLGNIEYTANCVLNTEGEYPVIEITPYAPFSLSGTYDVIIPASNLTIDGLSYGLNIKYVIDNPVDGPTSVEGIVETENANIYAIDGRIVARNASIEVLKTLNPGLYIVNGRKVLIRR